MHGRKAPSAAQSEQGRALANEKILREFVSLPPRERDRWLQHDPEYKSKLSKAVDDYWHYQQQHALQTNPQSSYPEAKVTELVREVNSQLEKYGSSHSGDTTSSTFSSRRNKKSRPGSLQRIKESNEETQPKPHITLEDQGRADSIRKAREFLEKHSMSDLLGHEGSTEEHGRLSKMPSVSDVSFHSKEQSGSSH